MCQCRGGINVPMTTRALTDLEFQSENVSCKPIAGNTRKSMRNDIINFMYNNNKIIIPVKLTELYIKMLFGI